MPNKDNFQELSEGISKAIKVGVGAVAGAVEKGVKFVGDLATEGTEVNKRACELGEEFARKGEEIFDKTAQAGRHLKDKVQDAVNSIPVGFENVMESLERFTDEQLEAVKGKAGEILALRAEQEKPCECAEAVGDCEEEPCEADKPESEE